MGHWEDFWYNIYDSIDKHGLKKEFDAQLKKMSRQGKHRFRDTRSRWSYAHDKVLKQHINKKR
mgnify:CR=1 FL=1